MPSNHTDPDYTGLETRLKTGAPGERDAASLDRVRSHVAARRRIPYGWGAVATVAVAVVVVGFVMLWQPAPDAGRDSSAFAYERVEELIAPVDGVVHVVLRHELISDSNLPAGIVEEGQPWRTETWAKSDQSAVRYEWVDRGDRALWYVVQADGRRLNVDDATPGYDPYVTEAPYDPDADPSLGGQGNWMESALTRSFARAIEERSCEVTETVDASGTPVWSVKWTEEDELNRLRYEALFRRPDYRPLKIFSEVTHKNPPEGYPEGFPDEISNHETTVEVWEVLDEDEVPDDLFESRADVTDPVPSFEVIMQPDDERVADIGFRVFTVAEEAGLDPASAAKFVRGRYFSQFELEWSGMYGLSFGEVNQWAFDSSAPVVYTFATNDRQDKQQWWGGHVFGSIETTGEVDGYAYTLRYGDPVGALLMTSVDGQAIVITGPDTDTVLRMLGALEPLE